jgi:hypothetical protein
VLQGVAYETAVVRYQLSCLVSFVPGTM